jgi:hypothetical protein
VKVTPKVGYDADRVLVTALEHFLGSHQQTFAFERNLAQLDVPIAGELVPADLHRAGNQIRLVDRLAGGFSLALPAPLHGHTTKHRRFARTGRRAADGVRRRRRVPEIGEHMHAAGLDFGGLRVLVLVDHVLVHALIHQLMDFGLGPGLTEGRQVLPRVAVEHQLVMDHRVGMARIVFRRRKFVLGHADRQIGRGVHLVIEFLANAFFLM